MPVLTSFYILHPDNLDKSVLTRKSYINTLINHYEYPLADTHKNDTVTADRIIDKIKNKKTEVEADFFESFDGSLVTLSNMVKNETRELIKEGKIKQ